MTDKKPKLPKFRFLEKDELTKDYDLLWNTMINKWEPSYCPIRYVPQDGETWCTTRPRPKKK